MKQSGFAWLAGILVLSSGMVVAYAGRPPQQGLGQDQTGGGARRANNNQQAAAKKKRAAAQQKPVAPADRIFGAQITNAEGYHNQPAAAETTDGRVHAVWVQYIEGKGDFIVARAQQRGQGRGGQGQTSLSPTQILSSQPSQYIRPVLAASGEQLWCLWTETADVNVSRIWFSCYTDGKWSKAARFLPDETGPHQNPEIAATPDGKVAAVYQHHNGKSYDIRLARWENNAWGAAKALGDGGGNEWDPVAAFDAKGKLHVAWSAFRDGDYDVMWARPDADPAAAPPADAASNAGADAARPRRISARGEYDLHPWLAGASDGSVWACWDVVKIRNHGDSGGTTITGANKQRDRADTNEGQANHWSGIEVRVLDGDTVRVPGKPREQIIAPAGYVLAHRGMAKIALSSNGEPWVVYRTLMKPIAAWSPNIRDGYLWEVQARPFREGAWQDAVCFNDSDGYLEEPAVAVSKTGIKVVYTSEHRHSSARDVMYFTKKPDAPPIDAAADAIGAAGAEASVSAAEIVAVKPSTAPATTQPIAAAYDHHHDFDGYTGWQGDVYLASLPMLISPDLKLAELPTEERPADTDVDPRLTRAAGAHSTEAGGKTFKLLWGDLHRHSNVSRCSVGNEPNPDDLYRYGLDIDLYDFLGLSDHSEYSTDYYWWRQQKVADLFHIPGVFSSLYNSEWSMPFPNGHTNTVFPSRHKVKLNGQKGATNTLVGGWEMLERGGYKAITIPHTPADPGMGTAWPSYNPKYMRLCEIFQSCRGSYEHEGCPRQHAQATNQQGFYWKALEKGYRLGIICSSDHGYGAAYACVYAQDNTRDAVWQALYDRRCYGSTTYGLVLEVRSGERWMGEEFTSSTAPQISAYVRGSVPIRSVEVIGRSKVLHAQGSVEKPINQKEVRLNWTDAEWDQLQGEQWYYVRVIQQDDEMAWSSPMWVTKQ